MLRSFRTSGLFVTLLALSTFAAAEDRRDSGLAGSGNFAIVAPQKNFLAARVLESAEIYRAKISKELLGRSLAEGEEHVCIHVAISPSEDEGRVLTRTDENDRSHMIWLRTTEDRATGSTLAHELAHTVLHARFPKGMPVWANEGLASRYDDDERRNLRSELLRNSISEKRCPSVAQLFAIESIARNDQLAYAASESLVDFLLQNGGNEKFLEFIDDGMNGDWQQAVKMHYGIETVGQLQNEWQSSIR